MFVIVIFIESMDLVSGEADYNFSPTNPTYAHLSDDELDKGHDKVFNK